MRDNESWNKTFKNIYKIMDKSIVPFSWIVIIISIMLDACQYPYWHPALARFFCYDNGNALTIALTIWTFITVLLIYYLDRMNERCYGVRLRDVLELKKIENKRRFLSKGVVFLVELFVLIFVSIASCPITLFMLTVLQFFKMIYALFIIYINTSEVMILEKIKEQFINAMTNAKGNKGFDLKMLYEKFMLIQMISNLDYLNKEKKEHLLEVLCQEKAYAGEQSKYVLRELATLILDRREDKEIYKILNNWVDSSCVPAQHKREILFSFIQRGKHSDFEYCEKILETLDESQQRMGIIYCIARNEYLESKVDQNYRNYYIERLKKMLGGLLTEEEATYQWDLKMEFKKEENDA